MCTFTQIRDMPASGLTQKQSASDSAEPDNLRYTKIPLNNGSGAIPALGFGTLIPDPAVTITATRDALDAGFRHFECAE